MVHQFCSPAASLPSSSLFSQEPIKVILSHLILGQTNGAYLSIKEIGMKHLFPLFFWEEINAFFHPFSFKAQLSSSLRAKICFCFFLPSLATRRKVNTGKTRSIYSTPRARVQLQFTRVLGIFIICCPSFSTLENGPIFHSAQMVDTTLSRWRTGHFTAPGKQHSATHPLMQGTVQTRSYTRTHTYTLKRQEKDFVDPVPVARPSC